jgi:hypothetical protein
MRTHVLRQSTPRRGLSKLLRSSSKLYSYRAHFDRRTLGSGQMPEMPLTEMRTLNFKALKEDHQHYLTISTRNRPNFILKHIHHHERPYQLHAKDCLAGWPPICFGCLPYYPEGTVCSGTWCSVCKTIVTRHLPIASSLNLRLHLPSFIPFTCRKCTITASRRLSSWILVPIP